MAETALSLGYELQCALPFERDTYRNDFADGSPERREFDTLLQRASAVTELDGDRNDSSAAYEAVGRFVLENSDVLIAIWDGLEARGVGGTGQIVAEALGLQVAVVVIPPTGTSLPTIYVRDPAGTDRQLAIGQLETQLSTILFPYLSDHNAAAGEAKEHRDQQIRHYADFCKEKHPSLRWASRLQLGTLWRRSWRMFIRPFRSGRWQRPPAVDAARVRPGDDARLFGRHLDWVGRLASYYSDLYRSSFVLNYFLGALAVTCVLLSFAVRDYEVPFLMTELACILIIFVVFVVGKRKRWHERAVDYRILSEQLRQMEYLGPLGLSLRPTRPPAHAEQTGDVTGTWMNWHFRAILRGTGIPAATFASEYLQRHQETIVHEWLAGQRDYHHNNHRTLERAHTFCDRMAGLLFTGTALACTMHLVLPHVPGVPHDLHDTLSPWLIVLAASLPAWAAAFHGISSQAEFERLVERSRSMEQRLSAIANQFRAEQEAVSHDDLTQRVREVADVMWEEVADWRVLYRAHEIPTA
jgi:hypothetical protein